MEQFIQEMTTQYPAGAPPPPPMSWKSKSEQIEETEKNFSGGFECNICLDSVNDPVVTFCGHLYCWPCIYKWIHSDKPDHHQKPQCPVCKTEVSEKTLIPLYAPGLSTKSSDEKSPEFGLVIPQRPQTPKRTATPSPGIHHRNIPVPQPDPRLHFHPYPSGYMASPVLNIGGGRTNMSQPMVGMFGEMVYSRIFGGNLGNSVNSVNSETTLYSYPNSYNVASNASPRLRRHMMEVDKSLSRISFFLFCCLILCLILF